MMHLFLAQQQAQAPGLLQSLLPMFLIFGIFYFIWFMPIRRKQKALEQMLNALQKGDKVITNGGLYGEVSKVEGEVIVLKLAENVRVRIARRAIAGLEGNPDNNPPEKTDKTDKTDKTE